ncbi:hypothetical protein HE1_00080 [Holospora elegans E1]|uniref:Uncharacterized protein n=2 Tax=Holospora TaxID=44747 RepID=A0A023DWR3_9PROT|nr:hypothetical protein HE1_00080 [Holospora elegans E1]
MQMMVGDPVNSKNPIIPVDPAKQKEYSEPIDSQSIMTKSLYRTPGSMEWTGSKESEQKKVSTTESNKKDSSLSDSLSPLFSTEYFNQFGDVKNPMLD